MSRHHFIPLRIVNLYKFLVNRKRNSKPFYDELAEKREISANSDAKVGSQRVAH